MNHEIIKSITEGQGFYIIKSAVDKESIDYALRFIRKVTSRLGDNVLERRVWNLHTRHDIFSKIAHHSLVKDIYNVILGTKHRINSFGANRLMPGGQAQEAHTDYPYWGLFDKTTLPLNINSSFALACQTLIPLQDFTKQNGATAVVPNSQLLCSYPDDTMFNQNAIQLELEAGDLLMYHSLLWHRASHNHSDSDRTCLLGQYTAGFVRDMM